ncbi:hypothetical protein [Aureimonas pseudogalii]|uniref:Uncharacterized protein n=1 Tax=Aureimonas pseudogalii TaxID=1744844 RepID=A0A7W6H403_9HYPH|nr:hypothetical protein [Aureimonas pseudogalii]
MACCILAGLAFGLILAAARKLAALTGRGTDPLEWRTGAGDAP